MIYPRNGLIPEACFKCNGDLLHVLGNASKEWEQGVKRRRGFCFKAQKIPPRWKPDDRVLSVTSSPWACVFSPHFIASTFGWPKLESDVLWQWWLHSKVLLLALGCVSSFSLGPAAGFNEVKVCGMTLLWDWQRRNHFHWLVKPPQSCQVGCYETISWLFFFSGSPTHC